MVGVEQELYHIDIGVISPPIMGDESGDDRKVLEGLWFMKMQFKYVCHFLNGTVPN